MVCTVIWLASGASGQFWPVWILIIVALSLVRNGWALYGPGADLDAVEADLDARRERRREHAQRHGDHDARRLSAGPTAGSIADRAGRRPRPARRRAGRGRGARPPGASNRADPPDACERIAVVAVDPRGRRPGPATAPLADSPSRVPTDDRAPA